jgi:hypothetical protein
MTPIFIKPGVGHRDPLTVMFPSPRRKIHTLRKATMAERRVHGEPKKVVSQHVSVASAAESGDQLKALKALRDKLAREIDECGSKRDLAALARQLSAVLADIEAFRPPRISKRDELAAKRARRRAAAFAADPRGHPG